MRSTAYRCVVKMDCATTPDKSPLDRALGRRGISFSDRSSLARVTAGRSIIRRASTLTVERGAT